MWFCKIIGIRVESIIVCKISFVYVGCWIRNVIFLSTLKLLMEGQAFQIIYLIIYLYIYCKYCQISVSFKFLLDWLYYILCIHIIYILCIYCIYIYRVLLLNQIMNWLLLAMTCLYNNLFLNKWQTLEKNRRALSSANSN